MNAGVLLLVAAALLADQQPWSVDLQQVDGDWRCTLRARSAPLSEILPVLAEGSGRKLKGAERLDGVAPVSIDLEARPLEGVLHVLAGCASLRARVSAREVELLPDLSGAASAAECAEQASIAYLRALRDHPDHPEGARAERELARYRAEAGDWRAAIGHLDLLVRKWPESEVAPEALLECSRLLIAARRWSEAAERLTELAGLPSASAYQAETRLELARCLTELGDARQALSVLEVLDRNYPDARPAELQARAYVRAIALHGAGRTAEALGCLEDAEASGALPEWRERATQLRAQALEHFDRPGEAARAWLHLADLQSGPDRAAALREAARTALDAGDAVGVLLIHRLAAGTGAERDLEPLAREARTRLGLTTGEGRADLHRALTQVQVLIDRDLFGPALQQLDGLRESAYHAEEPEFLRFALAEASALEPERGLDAALEVLRAAWQEVRTPDSRRAICRAAGELFEKHRRWSEAIRAYGGDLP